MLKKFQDFLQIQQATVSHTERLVSVVGSFLGIVLVFLTSSYVLGQAGMADAGVAVIIASMGASAVLLFAAPHSTFSQPWPLVGSHVVSALIGISCVKFIPSPFIAAAAAVSLSIGAMHMLRCIHPPGGATALAVVIGSDSVHSLGYQFILAPVLVNVVILLVAAVAVNYPFPWRRYPVSWHRPPTQPDNQASPYPDISHADFVVALSEIDTFVDITEDNLLQIYERVTRDKPQTNL